MGKLRECGEKKKTKQFLKGVNKISAQRQWFERSLRQIDLLLLDNFQEKEKKTRMFLGIKMVTIIWWRSFSIMTPELKNTSLKFSLYSIRCGDFSLAASTISTLLQNMQPGNTSMQ